MKKQTRGFVTFVAVGCVGAVGVGWGVWRSAAPEESRVASTPAISRAASPSAAGFSPVTSTSDPTPEPTSEVAKLPPQQAPMLESDPYLPPNAFIPQPGAVAVSPTRIYGPSFTTEVQQAPVDTQTQTTETEHSETVTTPESEVTVQPSPTTPTEEPTTTPPAAGEETPTEQPQPPITAEVPPLSSPQNSSEMSSTEQSPFSAPATESSVETVPTPLISEPTPIQPRSAPNEVQPQLFSAPAAPTSATQSESTEPTTASAYSAQPAEPSAASTQQ
ncbi:hypothetical protein [Corynebacterium hindlerae]|uniref:hypothetical protein n=1 Tax=Corynebacterium hindlerae TaxID=699041 RepID=UPI003AABE76E